MRRRKCVADVEIRQRRELFHHLRSRLLLVAQAQLHFKERLFLRAEANVVHEENLAVFHCANGFPRRRAADVLHPAHLPAEQLGKNPRVRAGAVEVLIFDVAALMRQQDGARALLRELPHGGHAGCDALDTLQSIRSAIHSLIDIHAAKDSSAPERKILQSVNSKPHMNPSFTAFPS